MKNLLCLAISLLLTAFVGAQTETVVNGAGYTVVELLTENAAGVVQTEILGTLTGSTTSQSLSSPSLSSSLSSASTTGTATTTQPLGPVEQTTSEAGVPYGETPYSYTTTNANGATVVMQGVFTPTGPQTVLPTPTTTGTVLGYSQWLSMVGTYTVAANAAHHTSMSVPAGWYYLAVTALTGLVGGAWLIIF